MRHVKAQLPTPRQGWRAQVPRPRVGEREARGHLPAVPPTAALETARASAARLMAHTPLTAWCVARVADDRFSFLVLDASVPVPVAVGAEFPFSQMLCSKMVSGEAPTIAPRVRDVPAFSSLAIVGQLGIASYAGVPFYDQTRLLGTVFGVGFSDLDLSPGGAEILSYTLHSEAAQVGHAFERQLVALQHERGDDREAASSFADELTRLPDRRGWGLLLAREEVRAARYGDSVGVAVVDVGQVRRMKTVRKAAAALVEEVGDGAAVTRVDGRRFGVLLPGRSAAEVADTLTRIDEDLTALGTSPTSSWTMRSTDDGLQGAWQRATEDLFSRRRDTLQRQD